MNSPPSQFRKSSDNGLPYWRPAETRQRSSPREAYSRILSQKGREFRKTRELRILVPKDI